MIPIPTTRYNLIWPQTLYSCQIWVGGCGGVGYHVLSKIVWRNKRNGLQKGGHLLSISSISIFQIKHEYLNSNSLAPGSLENTFHCWKRKKAKTSLLLPSLLSLSSSGLLDPRSKFFFLLQHSKSWYHKTAQCNRFSVLSIMGLFQHHVLSDCPEKWNVNSARIKYHHTSVI